MKNSSFVALVVFLIASIGTLLGAYLYLTKREKELNEYEKLLFSDEFDDANTDTPDTDDFSYEHNEQ